MKLGFENTITIGINVRSSSKEKFAEWIVDGSKKIETRDTPSLHGYVGKRVGVIRTGMGKSVLIGYVTILSEIKYYNRKEFDHDFKYHRVSPGSPYYMRGDVKYGYLLSNPERIEPQEITTKGYVARRIG